MLDISLEFGFGPAELAPLAFHRMPASYFGTSVLPSKFTSAWDSDALAVRALNRIHFRNQGSWPPAHRQPLFLPMTFLVNL
jgi:hypothetical protein